MVVEVELAMALLLLAAAVAAYWEPDPDRPPLESNRLEAHHP